MLQKSVLKCFFDLINTIIPQNRKGWGIIFFAKWLTLCFKEYTMILYNIYIKNIYITELCLVTNS